MLRAVRAVRRFGEEDEGGRRYCSSPWNVRRSVVIPRFVCRARSLSMPDDVASFPNCAEMQ